MKIAILSVMLCLTPLPLWAAGGSFGQDLVVLERNIQGMISRKHSVTPELQAQIWYMNGPRSTWTVDQYGIPRTLINLGGAPDTPIADPWKLQDDPANYDILLRQAYEVLTDLKGQSPAAVMEGPFGFTPDGTAVVGELQGPNVIGAVGSQGYGGTESGLLGWVTAKQITETSALALALRDKFVPLKHFGLDRFNYYRCELSLKTTAHRL